MKEPSQIERSPVKAAMPSARTGKNTFFGNDENASERSNKDDTGIETLQESDSSQDLDV